MVRGPPTVEILHCHNRCTHTGQKYEHFLVAQRSLQSMRGPSLFERFNLSNELNFSITWPWPIKNSSVAWQTLE